MPTKLPKPPNLPGKATAKGPPPLPGATPPVSASKVNSVIPGAIAKPGGQKSILVVEDDEATRRLLVRALRTVYTVYEAPDGEHALQMLQQIPAVDCVVTDIMMPKLSGVSLAQKLKSDPRFKSVPLMFVTGSGSPSVVVDGINVGARFLIRKPFSLRDLLEKVGSVFGK